MREEVKNWMRQGDADLKTAKDNIKTENFYASVLFAQQAAEKYLNASTGIPADHYTKKIAQKHFSFAKVGDMFKGQMMEILDPFIFWSPRSFFREVDNFSALPLPRSPLWKLHLMSSSPLLNQGASPPEYQQNLAHPRKDPTKSP